MSPVQRSNSRRERLLSVLLVSVCVGFVIVVCVPETTSSAAETPVTSNKLVQISPGSDIHRELAAGAMDAFVVTVEAGKLIKFSVDKGDLVLSTVLYGPTGNKVNRTR